MFIWSFLLVFFALFWAISLALFLVGRKFSLPVLARLGRAPLVALTSLALLLVVVGVASSLWPDNPRDFYEQSFKLPPSNDVSAIQCDVTSGADSGAGYMKFNASLATIRKIASKGWRHMAPADMQNEDFSFYRQQGTPTWWNPATSQSTVVYEASKRLGHFSSEQEIMVYDKVTGQAYYGYSGVD